MKKNIFNIAVIPGDGIGKEVMPEGIKVLKKVADKFDLNTTIIRNLEKCCQIIGKIN